MMLLTKWPTSYIRILGGYGSHPVLTLWPGLCRLLGLTLLMAALVFAGYRWYQHRRQEAAIGVLRENVWEIKR